MKRDCSALSGCITILPHWLLLHMGSKAQAFISDNRRSEQFYCTSSCCTRDGNANQTDKNIKAGDDQSAQICTPKNWTHSKCRNGINRQKGRVKWGGLHMKKNIMFKERNND